MRARDVDVPFQVVHFLDALLSACRCMWLIRSCYCNSNRLCVQKKKMSTNKKNIPLVLSQPTPVYHFFCQSVCLFCSRVFVSVFLSVCQPFCQCRSTSRTASRTKILPFFSFFYFRQMADSLMLSDLVSVVYCLALGCFARSQSKWTVTLTAWSVMEPRCCSARTERRNLPVHSRIPLFLWPGVAQVRQTPIPEWQGVSLSVSWMDYWMGILGKCPGSLDQGAKKWHCLLGSRTKKCKSTAKRHKASTEWCKSKTLW